jgi:hypothetical protein
MSQVKQFRERLQKAYSSIDYIEFCKRAQLQQDNYSETLWNQWIALSKVFAKFDNETLERILG